MYNPYQKYKEQSLTTLTPAELVLKLFDEGVKQMKLADKYINEKDLSSANASLLKSQNIVETLRLNLDDRYEISGELDRLYTYIYNSLIEANLKKDTELLNEVCEIFTELRETFKEANKMSK